MTTAPTPRRRADAARNDEILLDTGLQLLREKGPDRLTALDLARRAGLTTGAVYARYENNEEILVGLWQNRIREPLRQFFADAVQTLTSDADDDPVLRAITEDTPSLLGAISLLIATPRVTELGEVIIPDIQNSLRDLGISDDIRDVRSTQLLSAVSAALGSLYFAAAGMFSSDEWPMIRMMMRHVTAHTAVESWPPMTPRVPFDIAIDTGHETRDAFVNAAAGVIARSGMDRATTQRVARAAGLPPSALFAEYQNRQALFADVAAKLLQEIYQEHRYRQLYGAVSLDPVSADPPTDWHDPRLQNFRDLMTSSVAESTLGLLAPIGRDHRRIRLEFQLAAIHNSDVRSELQRVDESTNDMAARMQQSLFGFPVAVAGPGARTSRAIAQGAMLLEDVSHMVHGRDIRYINAPLADFCCQMALDSVTAPTSAVPSRR